jgi:hypothetical protein
MFCTLVRQFGKIPYQESGNITKNAGRVRVDMTIVLGGNITGLSNNKTHTFLPVHEKANPNATEHGQMDKRSIR